MGRAASCEGKTLLYRASKFDCDGCPLKPRCCPKDHRARNYLSVDVDQRTIVAGLRLCRRLLANRHLQKFVEAEYLPGTAIQTDDEMLDFARAMGGTVFHPTSTCRMGSDGLAVVDQSLRVHGVDGLRVVDASVMPMIISGNTNAATIMIAEKAADLVRNEARRLAA